MIVLRVTSADPLFLMEILQRQQIVLFDAVLPDPLTLEFRILRKDYITVRQIVKGRGETLKILGRQGIYWRLKALLHRPVLIIGMAAILLISAWVPSRIFFVQVSGNAGLSETQILQAAQAAGLRFGCSRRQVRSEKIKNSLLELLPELQWAGVNTYGCVAVITVRERQDTVPSQVEKQVSSIVANHDGIIMDMTVTQGNALVKPGQAVKKGQVLVSGYLDCGRYIQAGASSGEIYARTQREITAIFPTDYALRGKVRGKYQKVSLIIGKNEINFAKDSGISGGTCAKIVSDYSLTLPGGFVLPVTLRITQETFYQQEACVPQDTEAAIRKLVYAYLPEQMIAGRVLSGKEQLRQEDGGLYLDGSYACYEMIGILRKEESLDNYGENR